jgi:hypothetical protein
MHRGDKISWDVLGEDSEWKISSGEPDRKEMNISKRIIKKEDGLRFHSSGYTYEGGSKIFRTGAAIYTAVVIAQSTGRW